MQRAESEEQRLVHQPFPAQPVIGPRFTADWPTSDLDLRPPLPRVFVPGRVPFCPGLSLGFARCPALSGGGVLDSLAAFRWLRRFPGRLARRRWWPTGQATVLLQLPACRFLRFWAYRWQRWRNSRSL